jgi:hypothetical protein
MQGALGVAVLAGRRARRAASNGGGGGSGDIVRGSKLRLLLYANGWAIEVAT